jgi:pyruvate dehydrogenase kinase 2/3/4
VPLLKDMKSVQAVKDIYISSFLTLIKEPSIDNMVQEALFARKLELLYERHSNILVQMARGAYELREALRNGSLQAQQRVHGSHRPWEEDQDSVQFEHYDDCLSFLDRFYTSRIGIRVLAGQYLALRQPPLSGYVGLICQNTSPYDIVKMAIRDATFMCTKKYGDAPNVLIKGRLDLTFAYIPTHLHYIVLELLKNAMRATVEHHGIQNAWPSVEVVIADGVTNEDIAIKISDEGGGISRSNMKKIWSYLFTTADASVQTALMSLAGSGDHSVEAPLAGLGYGLPISRAYAKYFGGDLSVMSMEGYGTDVFLHLRRLGDSVEPLPI